MKKVSIFVVCLLVLAACGPSRLNVVTNPSYSLSRPCEAVFALALGSLCRIIDTLLVTGDL